MKFIYHKRWWTNTVSFLIGDIIALIMAMIFAGIIRYWMKADLIPPSRSFILIPFWCVGAILFKLVPGWGLGSIEELRRIQLLLLGLFAAAAITMFFTQSGIVTSRLKFIFVYLLSTILVPSIRLITKHILIKIKEWGMPTVVYGNDDTVAHVLDIIGKEPGLGYVPIGIYDDQTSIGEFIGGVPVLGGLNDSTSRADVAILGAPSIPREKLKEFLDGSLAKYRRVIIIPDLLDIPSLWVSSRDFMGVLGLELVRNLLNPAARLFKGLTEWLFVAILSPFWFPLCLLIALLIWIEDRRSPLFLQKRVGHNGRNFRTFKFRTMVPNAEEVLKKQLEDNPELKKEWETNHKLTNDSRITLMGRILRRSSLDELPQLINVLKRNMSLVGPRPLPLYHHEHLPEHVRILREKVLPGITGMWQVSGRSEVGTEGMVRWDTYYVRNWSTWLDIVILVRTIRSVISGSGAY